jgi:hypothetical protein
LENNKQTINSNDEVIINNINETVGKQETATDYLVRNSNQIKHIENLGDWKTEDNNIYSSKKNIPFGYATKLNLATSTSIFSTDVA